MSSSSKTVQQLQKYTPLIPYAVGGVVAVGVGVGAYYLYLKLKELKPELPAVPSWIQEVMPQPEGTGEALITDADIKRIEQALQEAYDLALTKRDVRIFDAAVDDLNLQQYSVNLSSMLLPWEAARQTKAQLKLAPLLIKIKTMREKLVAELDAINKKEVEEYSIALEQLDIDKLNLIDIQTAMDLEAQRQKVEWEKQQLALKQEEQRLQMEIEAQRQAMELERQRQAMLARDALARQQLEAQRLAELQKIQEMQLVKKYPIEPWMEPAPPPPSPPPPPPPPEETKEREEAVKILRGGFEIQ